jgi:hypothetical protein
VQRAICESLGLLQGLEPHTEMLATADQVEPLDGRRHRAARLLCHRRRCGGASVHSERMPSQEGIPGERAMSETVACTGSWEGKVFAASPEAGCE